MSVLLASACGRYDYDSVTGSPGGSPVDAGTIDADPAIDAQVMACTPASIEACPGTTFAAGEGTSVIGGNLTTEGSTTLAGTCGGEGFAEATVLLTEIFTRHDLSLAADFDAVLYIYSDACELGAEEACINNTGPGGTEVLSTNVEASSKLLVIDSADGTCGPWSLTVMATPLTGVR